MIIEGRTIKNIEEMLEFCKAAFPSIEDQTVAKMVTGIESLIFRPDGRGLHDLAVGSATVTLATYRALATTEGTR